MLTSTKRGLRIALATALIDASAWDTTPACTLRVISAAAAGKRKRRDGDDKLFPMSPIQDTKISPAPAVASSTRSDSGSVERVIPPTIYPSLPAAPPGPPGNNTLGAPGPGILRCIPKIHETWTPLHFSEFRNLSTITSNLSSAMPRNLSCRRAAEIFDGLPRSVHSESTTSSGLFEEATAAANDRQSISPTSLRHHIRTDEGGRMSSPMPRRAAIADATFVRAAPMLSSHWMWTSNVVLLPSIGETSTAL